MRIAASKTLAQIVRDPSDPRSFRGSLRLVGGISDGAILDGVARVWRRRGPNGRAYGLVWVEYDDGRRPGAFESDQAVEILS